MTAAARLPRLARTKDYMFGSDTLIGAASMLLLALSGYASWHGMRDFVAGSDADLGSVSRQTETLVAVVVFALTFLMWLALRESFGRQRRLRERLITIPLYFFLAIWSVGFGYGYWWSIISGPETTRTGLTSLQAEARDASAVVAARLDAVRAQLNSVVAWSDGQMTREEQSGGSCGVASNAGRGPLYNARRSVRDAVTAMRDGIDQSWFKPVSEDVAALNRSLSEFGGASVTARQQSFESAARQIRTKAQSIANRSNELGRAYAGEMRALSQTVSAAPGAAGSSCNDPTLAEGLKQTANAASQPAELDLREVAFNEGSAGVANSIKKLWSNIGYSAVGAWNWLTPNAAHLAIVTRTAEPFSGRDLIALLAAIGVDLGLLALAALSPSTYSARRQHGLSAIHANLKLPTLSATEALRAAIRTAVSSAPGTNLKWVRQHLIHHDGESYFVIPSLHYADASDHDEELRALAINQLAGVLVDLKLVRGLPKGAVAGDPNIALSNASNVQRLPEPKFARFKSSLIGKAEKTGKGMPDPTLLAKARRALSITGWGAAATSDVEVFRLSRGEGITPLLILLTEQSKQSDKAIVQQKAEATALIPVPDDVGVQRAAIGNDTRLRSSKALSVVTADKS